MARGNGSPRVVRNFWVHGTRSDGIEVKGQGPTGTDGEMTLVVLVRDNGRVGDTSIRVNCEVAGEELLITADQYLDDGLMADGVTLKKRRTIQLYRGKR